MDVRQLREIKDAFGYDFKGDIGLSGRRLNTIDVAVGTGMKIAMYVPVINFIAIGIIFLSVNDLFTTRLGGIILARCMISLVAAPILLPIDIIATLAIRSLLKKAEKAVPA